MLNKEIDLNDTTGSPSTKVSTAFLLKGPKVDLTTELSREIMATAGFKFEQYCEISDTKPSCFCQSLNKLETRANSMEIPKIAVPIPRRRKKKKSLELKRSVTFLSETESLEKPIRKYKLKPITRKKKLGLIVAVQRVLRHSRKVRTIRKKFKDREHMKFITEIMSLKSKKSRLHKEFKDKILRIEKDLGFIERYLGNVPTRN